jgi:hypothetical protein
MALVKIITKDTFYTHYTHAPYDSRFWDASNQTNRSNCAGINMQCTHFRACLTLVRSIKSALLQQLKWLTETINEYDDNDDDDDKQLITNMSVLEIRDALFHNIKYIHK